MRGRRGLAAYIVQPASFVCEQRDVRISQHNVAVAQKVSVRIAAQVLVHRAVREVSKLQEQMHAKNQAMCGP